MKRTSILAGLVLGALTLTANAKNDQQAKVADHNFYGTTVSFQSRVSAAAGSISISGPNGFVARKASNYGVPSIQLANYGHVADGVYHYQLVVKQGGSQRLVDNGTNGRDPNKAHYGVKGAVQGGHFMVKNGQIVIPSKMIESSASKF